MEKFNEILNSLGATIPMADWFTRLDGTQKAVFLSQTGIAALLAILLMLALRKRMRVVPKTPEQKAFEKALADHNGEFLLEAAKSNLITGKEYKDWCRRLGKELPDLTGSSYSKRANQVQKVQRLKIDIAGRIAALRAWNPISLYAWQRKAKENDNELLKAQVADFAKRLDILTKEAKKAKAAPGDAAAEEAENGLGKYRKRIA